MKRIDTIATAAVTSLLVAAMSAGAASGPPLPTNERTGKAAYRGEAAQNQRIADLDARVRDTEAVVGFLRRCVSRNVYEVAPGKFALLLNSDDATCTR